MVVLAGVVALAVAGCSTVIPPTATAAPVLSVTTGLYPLAQIAELVGGTKAAVDDVVPPGVDPLTFVPTAVETRVLRASGLVLEVGGGFQPGMEKATAGANVMSLGGAPGTDPYLWLDPMSMGRAVAAVTKAMADADAPAAPLYESNARSVQAQITSLGFDYSSTLQACPGTTLAVPDQAFSGMAADYGLRIHIVAPSASTAAISSLAASLQSGGVVAAVSEPWVDNTGLDGLASVAHLHVHRVDTLAGVPATGSGTGGTGGYFSLMEQNLGVLSSALGCNTSEQ
jgi:ABC-type Zn uptake system ZnuABC Zn-binding protein ZnuA